MDHAALRPSRRDVIEILSALVAIDSVNPSLVPGAAGEARIAEFVADWLRRAGLQVEMIEAAPGRPSVVGWVPANGAGRAPSLMLNAHLDTVGVAGMDRPFEARVEGDRLYGRGAYDMKGSLAAIMLAAAAVQRQGGGSGDLILTAVADEEYASLGTQTVLDRWRADRAIVTEPTGLRLCTAHKGFAWFEVVTEGRAAHGSRADLGVDAIAHMGRVLSGLEAFGQDLRRRTPHALLGHASIHASLIEGGQELSSYPERCRLQVERRTLPGERADTVKAELDALLERLGAADPQFHASITPGLWRDAFEVDGQAPVVAALARAAADATGETPDIYGDTPWMDAALLAAAGIPTVVFGPGGAGAHAVEEYSHLHEVALAAEILARVALEPSG